MDNWIEQCGHCTGRPNTNIYRSMTYILSFYDVADYMCDVKYFFSFGLKKLEVAG